MCKTSLFSQWGESVPGRNNTDGYYQAVVVTDFILRGHDESGLGKAAGQVVQET